MTRGKKTCKILKEIRKQIAEKNDIEYITSECGFQGECKGTCPKCEQEVRYLESELRKRQQLGKVVTIAGISLGVAGTFAAYSNSQTQNNNSTTLGESELIETPKDSLINPTDTANIDTITTKYNAAQKQIPPPEITCNVGEISLLPAYIDDEPILGMVEEMPSFPGGDKALLAFVKENLVYPQEAIDMGWSGITIIKFVVDRDGKARNPEILKSSGYPLLDKEAMAIVAKLPQFTPGEQAGKKVPVYYMLPVRFKLSEKE
jgi:TonB family protein